MPGEADGGGGEGGRGGGGGGRSAVMSWMPRVVILKFECDVCRSQWKMSSGYSVLFCRQPTSLGQNSLRLSEAACWPCTPPRSIWCWGRGRGWVGVERGVGGRDGVGASGWSWSWWLGLRRGVKVKVGGGIGVWAQGWEWL